MKNDLLKTALSETLSERAMQEIPAVGHSFSLKYRLRRRKICKSEFEIPHSYIPLRRIPKAALIIILLSLLCLAACAVAQAIRGFTKTNYGGYSVLSPLSESGKDCVTEFYWLPKTADCKYLGREITYSGENITEVFSRYEYNGKLLTLRQSLPAGEMYFDTENGSIAPAEYNGFYGFSYDNRVLNLTCWQQDGYMFMLDTEDINSAEALIKNIEIYYE